MRDGFLQSSSTVVVGEYGLIGNLLAWIGPRMILAFDMLSGRDLGRENSLLDRGQI